MQQLMDRYPASAMFPFLPPSLLGAAGASGALHPLLGVPVLRTPADLLAQQYLSALAAAAAAQTPATSVSSTAGVGDHSLSRSVWCFSLVTFRVSRRRREMYCGHARLCVCLCACQRPHAYTIARTRM